jgi:HD-GYP domain-containing protein (c-di-GMP phosphodiesterase class II)
MSSGRDKMNNRIKKNRENLSIIDISNRHFHLLLGNLLVILLAVFLLTFSNIRLERLERESSDVMGRVNSVVLLLNHSEARDHAECAAAYLELMTQLETIDPLLSQKIDLSALPPAGNDEEQHSFYLNRLRTIALQIRQNLVGVRRILGYGSSSIIILVFIFSTVAFVNLLEWRRQQSRFLRDIGEGVDTVSGILKFKESYFRSPEDYDIIESRRFIEQVGGIARDISLDRSFQELSIHGSLELVLSDLSDLMREQISCDRIALAFIDGEGMITAETAYALYAPLELLPGYREALGNSSLKTLVRSRDVRVISDLEQYIRDKQAGGEEPSEATMMIFREGIRSSLTIPLYINERCVGFLFISSRRKNAYGKNACRHARRVFSLVKNKLYLEYIVQDIIARMSQSFTMLMSKKDNEPSDHIRRMTLYSAIIARCYADFHGGVTQQFVREISWYAPLHDIGKIGIPDSILLKPGSLSPQEMETMKGHVPIGVRVLEDIDRRLSFYFPRRVMDTAVNIVKGHHEKYDGSGYPEALKGEGIPLAGRIVAVADVFDALTSKRPYKEAFSIEKALDIMKNEMAGSFDPLVLDCLVRSREKILKVYEKYREI